METFEKGLARSGEEAAHMFMQLDVGYEFPPPTLAEFGLERPLRFAQAFAILSYIATQVISLATNNHARHSCLATHLMERASRYV